MKYLNSKYYLTISEEGKLIARFTRKEDAYMALPEKIRCFATPVKQGKIIFIDEKTIIFSSERRIYPVFENYSEYVQLKQKIKSDKEREVCL